jgi:acyl-CoA thioester hydrolase
MRPLMPTAENILELPSLLTVTVPPEWEDMNGHVNVQHYVALYDQAGWPMLEWLGIDSSYFQNQRQGIFDHEHHIWFLAEMHIGDQVSAHARLLACSDKRFHGVVFLVNITQSRLACVVEFVSTGADLESRRTAALPYPVKNRIDEIIVAHDALGWQAPRCGVMSA